MPLARFAPFCLAIALLAASPAAADVTIHCLYVGQADATLVQSSSGQTLLFDGGGNGDGNGIVVPYLDGLGVGALDYMAASHYHADHVGGLDEVYNAKGVINAVYDRGWDYSTATYTSYANAVAAKRQTAYDGLVIDLGDGVTATVVAVNGNGQSSSPMTTDSRENEYCLALLVECGDFDFFVAGDLTGGYSSERDIETSVGPEVGDIEVYRVNHHGSYTSSNNNFLDAVSAEVGVISVPVSSSYGHPAQDPLDRMAAHGLYLYQTAQGSSSTYPAGQRTIVNGHVVITTDGHGEYFVDGDQWTMDEPDTTPAPDAVVALAMLGNRPNPFNPATQILFRTDAGGPVTLTVYDLAGRVLRRDAFAAAAGVNRWRWDGRDAAGRDLSSGIYLYRVSGPGNASGTGRMVLAR